MTDQICDKQIRVKCTQEGVVGREIERYDTGGEVVGNRNVSPEADLQVFEATVAKAWIRGGPLVLNGVQKGVEVEGRWEARLRRRGLAAASPFGPRSERSVSGQAHGSVKTQSASVPVALRRGQVSGLLI